MSEIKIGLKNCSKALSDALRTDDIVFEAGSDRISLKDRVILNRFVNLKKICKDYVIKISSHTDSKGSNSSNQVLSEKGARAVRKYLISIGISPSQLKTRGYGETRPLFPNSTPENRIRNSRIEFDVILK